jgi:hypothetical protein
MDSTKKTIILSAVLMGSIALLSAGLYLKAMNTGATEEATTPMPMGMPQMKDRMAGMQGGMKGRMSGMMGKDMMGTEIMEEEIVMPAQPTDTDLSEEELAGIIAEISEPTGMESETAIEVGSEPAKVSESTEAEISEPTGIESETAIEVASEPAELEIETETESME